MSFYIDGATEWLTTSPIAWGIGMYVIYVVVCVALYLVLMYFFGWDNAERAMKIPAFGIRLVCEICVILFRIVTWPKRFRNRRVLIEEFNLTSEDLLNRSMIQHRVDVQLQEIADTLISLFEMQTQFRQTRPMTNNIREELAHVEGAIEVQRKEFWHYHSVAHKNGMAMRKRITDYTSQAMSLSTRAITAA